MWEKLVKNKMKVKKIAISLFLIFLFWNLISRISFLDTANNAEQQQNSKSKQFMDSMAQKSQMEVPTEFLNTIREEKHENKPLATSAIEPQITKKYPFNR